MNILDIIPLANIPRPNPQVLSYYYPERAERFSMIAVPLGRKLYQGLVVGTREVKDIKSTLRKGNFQLKKAARILHPFPVIQEEQFHFAQWMSEYYWTSLGFTIKRLIPSYLRKHPESLYFGGGIGESDEQTLWLFPDASFFQKVELPKRFIHISSSLSEKEEFQFFKLIASGKENIVLGTKRAVFAPYKRLKEVHIFEEADTSHKSWDQHPKYNAAYAAKTLARLHKAKVFYHSTLPSLESFAKKTPSKAFLPRFSKHEVTILNLAGQRLQKSFSDVLEKALRDCYLKGKQGIIYVNRRGEGRFILCRDCGFTPKCPKCDLSLVLHLIKGNEAKRRLLCHHCGYEEKSPSLCGECGSHEIRSYGFGTERVQKELSSLFPNAKLLRLDSDSAPREPDKKAILEKFFLGGTFLIATSMLFQAKPKGVDLVAAINPDTEINIPDFAQHERLFFNLWRLRQWTKGVFYLQTYNSSNPIFTALEKGNWRIFYREELEARKALNYPPFSSIIKLIYAHANERKAYEEAKLLQKKISYALRKKCEEDIHQLLGPAPSFLFKLRGRYSYNMLLKLVPKDTRCKTMILSLLPSGWEVDVDPVDSL